MAPSLLVCFDCWFSSLSCCRTFMIRWTFVYWLSTRSKCELSAINLWCTKNVECLLQCGQEMGEILLNLSRAWEVADTSTSHALVSKFPTLVQSLTDNYKSGKNTLKEIDAQVFCEEINVTFVWSIYLGFGKRLISAGRRFQSMGQYGQGELQKVPRKLKTIFFLIKAFMLINHIVRSLKVNELPLKNSS